MLIFLSKLSLTSSLSVEIILPSIALPDVVVFVTVELKPSLIVEPSKACWPPVTLPDAVVFFRVVFKRAMIACN